eukprot:s177_g15.t2
MSIRVVQGKLAWPSSTLAAGIIHGNKSLQGEEEEEGEEGEGGEEGEEEKEGEEGEEGEKGKEGEEGERGKIYSEKYRHG